MNTEDEPGGYVAISLNGLRALLAEAYESREETPTCVWVELKLADVLAEVIE